MSTHVQDIKERLGIVDVVGSYIKLDKSGVNFKARCPFHNEKTPSFFISLDRGTYYCFGCGQKGDIFTFVQEFEKVDFVGALKILAERAGVELQQFKNENKGENDRLRSVLELSTKFYEQNIHTPRNVKALEYLRERGLTDKTIDDWRIGFAENEWRHAKAYSRLNEVLGLDDFDAFLKDEIALKRFENLTDVRKGYNSKPDVQDIMRTLAIFGGFTEGVNLFSQFAILKSFSSNGRNLLTNIGNIIDWSQKDENLHSLCAIFLFNILKNERPEEFTEELKDSIKEAARLTFNIEIHLLDQIFSQGELPNLTKAELINFMKDRINRSLLLMGIETMYEIDEELLKNMEWFYDGFIAQEHADFFYHRPTAYTKHTKVYDSNNVFVSKDEIDSIKK